MLAKRPHKLPGRRLCMFFIKEKVDFKGPKSVVSALEMTRRMAEVLCREKLILAQFSIEAEKKEKKAWAPTYFERTVKTDCEFTDNAGKSHFAVAWVKVSNLQERWVVVHNLLFIKLDDMKPVRMEFTVPTSTLPLPDPIVAEPFQEHVMHEDKNPDKYDYSRIR